MLNISLSSKLRVNISLLLLLLFALPTISFAAPRIFYTDILSGPTTGGENNNGAYLTIFGEGFGNSQGASTVMIGGGEPIDYKVWSDNKISVQLGPAVSSGVITVTTSDGSADAPDSFSIVAGDIYFVSINGSDNNGVANDINQPFRSINAVKDLSSFGPGDFIVVRGGTFDLADNANNLQSNRFINAGKNGEPGAPITVMGYPGESVNVVKSTSSSMLFRSNTQEHISWWVVANFNVVITYCNPDMSVNVVSAGKPSATCPQSPSGRFSYGRIVNLDISGGCGSLKSSQVVLGLSDHVKVLGVSIHDSGDGGPAHSHPFYLSAEQNDNELGWSKIERYAQSRALIQLHTDSFSGSCFSYKSINNIKIHDNVIHDVTGQAILTDGGVGDVYIYNNVIYAAPYKLGEIPYEDVISLRGQGGHLNAKIYNNTIHVNPNHTAQGFAFHIGALSGGYCPEQITLYNNIISVAESQDRYFRKTSSCNNDSYIISDNNIWYGSSEGLPSSAGSNELNVDPQFVAPEVGDFHLSNNSPAIDSGSNAVTSLVQTDFDGNYRAFGTGIDIGAFESSGDVLPTPQDVQIQKL